MKFYEVKQQNNLFWHRLAFFLKKKDAERYQLLYNTKVVVHPTKIEEHTFLELEDFEDDLKD
jgi:hypothetical protein